MSVLNRALTSFFKGASSALMGKCGDQLRESAARQHAWIRLVPQGEYIIKDGVGVDQVLDGRKAVYQKRGPGFWVWVRIEGQALPTLVDPRSLQPIPPEYPAPFIDFNDPTTAIFCRRCGVKMKVADCRTTEDDDGVTRHLTLTCTCEAN